MIIRWPGNKKQVLRNVHANQLLKVSVKNALQPDNWNVEQVAETALFTEVTREAGIDFVHKEMDIIDFNTERLLPHKLSQYGPGLASADVDVNNLDDIFIGGTGDFPGKFFLQQEDGKFLSKDLPRVSGGNFRQPENMGILLFDADNDGDNDLLCANGSNEFPAGSKSYADHFFVNNGDGDFVMDSLALPANYNSKSCVKAADFDKDGDLDLFIGSRVFPGQYPKPVSSFIYRNDSKPGTIKFTDVTNTLAKDLQDIGLVCDALWTDFDNDGLYDLIVVGEWMPVTFLKNNNGKFENITGKSGIDDQIGWWNSISGGDFDNDGDIDYVIGNLGENSFYRASDTYPVSIYAKDFDNNKGYDAVTSVYLKDQKGIKKEFTAHNRDEMVEQMPFLKKRFLTYKDFAAADIQKLFPANALKDALKLKVNNLKSCYLKNLGSGRFELFPLPALAQLAPVYGMVVDDFNHDGNPDVSLCGNDYGTEVFNGRYDALNGLVLLGDGNGNFSVQSLLQSGLFIPGDAKALIKLAGTNNNYLLAASQNRGPLKIFRQKDNSVKFIRPLKNDQFVLLSLKNGKTRKQELYLGSSFLSQSSNVICKDAAVVKIEVMNHKGEKRMVE